MPEELIKVSELVLDRDAPLPILSVLYNKKYPVIVDITATVSTGFVVGQSITGDDDESNNFIIFNNINYFLGKTIWLKIVIWHPTIKNYDFNIKIKQGDKIIFELNKAGVFEGFTYMYEGVIFK